MYCPNPECPHIQATGEPAEYRVGVAQCNDCLTGLVETKPEHQGKHSELEYEEFVPVGEVRGAAMASFVKSLLQSVEIRFFIKGERVQDLIAYGQLGAGFNPITGAPVLFVEPSRAEEARELLSAIEEESREDSPDPIG